MLDSILDMFNGPSAAERQIEDLKAMDDHELADLGMSRDQIEAFVAEHAAKT